MKIGVPRERKTLEKRVAITPDGAQDLVRRGHGVLIETRAGEGAAFSDEEYRSAGAKIVDSLEAVWTQSEMVVKVKEPHELEYQYFRPGLFLFDYLHLASMPEVAKALVDGGVTGIAYELVMDKQGRLPLLEPMSEIAGKLSVLNGSFYLLSQNQGRGVLLSGAVGVPRAQVTIVGAGISGRAACEIAFGMGAHVSIFDINTQKLEHLRAEFGNQITTAFSTPAALGRALETTDLLIGAVLVPGAAAPKVISREMISRMPNGSVFVDISIDQGGCAETSRPTSLDEPTYLENGVVHYGVCNMPAQTARTSTMALTNATLPYIVRLAEKGPIEAMKNDAVIRGALNTHKGKLTNAKVSEAVGIDYSPIDEVL
ncbi:MAG: alanine dehydrogenase [Bdellovibrionales bacterium]|nr:alanine dehydrogenase [Bdellovibrionales bacterium]